MIDPADARKMRLPRAPDRISQGLTDMGRNGVEHFLRCLERSEERTAPYRHWLIADALPGEVRDGVLALPIAPPSIRDFSGRRESNNATRTYFNPETCARFPVCREIVRTFLDRRTIGALEARCGIDLAGAHLRIEYTQDTDGFWLEPHTDISVKLFTMLIYLSREPEAADWGTDIYDNDRNWVGRVPFRSNHGLIFIPADDTWHGVEKRPIKGVRRSLIVNYVTDAWRDRYELAAP